VARQYSLENVHLEGWKIAHSWQRGTAQAQLVKPVLRTLTIASAGWSPSTNGLARGKVVYVSATKPDEFQAYKGKLKGAIVTYEKPSELMSQGPASGPYDGPDVQAPQAPERRTKSESEKFDEARRAFLRREGVSAVLYDSGKHNALLSVSNVAVDYESRAALPTAMLTHEDYSLIWPLLQKGEVEIQIALTNSFSDAPVEVHNVVAEIRGAEKPDEVVILCAHLDSWDLGSGSTDDGTGVVSVLEAMRAIKAVGLDDHRTALCGNLSGGQRTRVSLACALVSRPELLVLDEPTVGLDPVLRVDLWDQFHQLAQRGTTLVVSSHVMDEADHCGDLLLMREGHLLAHSTPTKLREDTGCQSLEEAFLSVIRHSTAAAAG